MPFLFFHLKVLGMSQVTRVIYYSYRFQAHSQNCLTFSTSLFHTAEATISTVLSQKLECSWPGPHTFHTKKTAQTLETCQTS